MREEARPLVGRRIVVTRAVEQAGSLVEELERRGAEVILLPAVEFAPPADVAPLDAALASLEDFDWIVFTSGNAVRFFFARLRERGASPDKRPHVAAVGPATAAAVEAAGWRVDYTATQYRGAALAEELAAELAGRRVLLPRSDRASDELPGALRGAGAEVTDVVAYRTVLPKLREEDLRRLLDPPADAVTFASPSAFHSLAEQLGPAEMVALSRRSVFAAIGSVTARAMREAGVEVTVEAEKSTAAGLAAVLARHFELSKPSGVKRV